MTYTIDDIMALRHCYTREQVTGLFGDRASVTASEIASAPIQHADRIWVLVRLASTQTRVLWACECAERALIREREAGHEPDARSWRAVEVARAYARGEATQDDVAEAAPAAARAAWAAAAARAAWAAWAAAAAAELAAAAARAAWAAEWAAAEAAASCYAEQQWQLAHLVEMM